MVTVEKQYSLSESTINQVLAYLGGKPYTEVRTLIESVLKAQLIQTPTTATSEATLSETAEVSRELAAVSN